MSNINEKHKYERKKNPSFEALVKWKGSCLDVTCNTHKCFHFSWTIFSLLYPVFKEIEIYTIDFIMTVVLHYMRLLISISELLLKLMEGQSYFLMKLRTLYWYTWKQRWAFWQHVKMNCFLSRVIEITGIFFSSCDWKDSSNCLSLVMKDK